MRWSMTGRHRADIRAHWARVGAASTGTSAKAAPMSSRLRPTRCAALITATRRRTARWWRRRSPAVRVLVMRARAS